MLPRLEETIHIDFVTSSPTTGASSDADLTPTCKVFEDANDTAILTPTVTKRAAETGEYLVSISCTAANGFDVGKSYNVIASATVGGVTARAKVGSFQLRAAKESVTLAAADVAGNLPAELKTVASGIGVLATPVTLQALGQAPWDNATGADLASKVTATKGDTAAIKLKTDLIPASPATEAHVLSRLAASDYVMPPTVEQFKAGMEDFTINGTINDPAATATTFTGDNSLSPEDDVYNGMFFVPASGPYQKVPRVIEDYVGATRRITLASAYQGALADLTPFAIIGRAR